MFTGIFWLLAGTTKLVNVATKFATKPITRGIVLGLGMSFIVQGVHMMIETPWLAVLGLVVTYALLTNSRFPAMFALFIMAAIAAFVLDNSLVGKVLAMRPQFRIPEFTFSRMGWKEFVQGSLILAIPQIPLTIGNGVIALRAENNDLFHDRPVTDRMTAVSTGLINLFSAPFGGIPMCHGAGGMAGHVRFGARTGGALVMLGSIILVLALFFSNSIGLLFGAFPKAILGVIFFFAGAELAITTRDIGNKMEDVYVMLIVAGVAMWNMGVAFLAGIILYNLIQRKWLRL